MHLRYTNPDALIKESGDNQVYTLDQTPFL